MIASKGKAFFVTLSYSDVFLIKQAANSLPEQIAESRDVNLVHELYACGRQT